MGLELDNGWVKVNASASHNIADLSNCCPHPFNTYTRCLNNFCCYGLVYTCPLTPVSPQTFPQIQIGESWLKSFVVEVCKLCPMLWLRGCKTFQTASHIHDHDIHIQGIWAPSTVVEHMDVHSHHYPNQHLPRGRVGWNPHMCRQANNISTILLRL